MLSKKKYKKITELLLESQLITEQQLGAALEKQKKNGRSISRNLVELGYVRGEELAQYIAMQYKLPCISLDRYNVNNNLACLIPESVSNAYGVLPLDLIGDILTVGIVDVPDEELIRRVKKLTGFNIQVIVITTSDFDQYLQKLRDISYTSEKLAAGETERLNYITTPSYKGKERRRFTRFDKELKIKYEFRSEYNINTSVNISKGGLLIRSRSPLPLGSHIVIRIELPTWYEDIIIISRVARVDQRKDGESYDIALNFTSMDAVDSKKLSELIRTIRK